MAGWTSRYSPEETQGAYAAVPVPRSVVAADAARAATTLATQAVSSGVDVADSLIRARQVADSVVRSRSPMRDLGRGRPGESEAGGLPYAPRVAPASPGPGLLPRELVRVVPQLATLRGVADGDPYIGGGMGAGAGFGAAMLQPSGVRPSSPRRRGSRSPSPTRHRRPIASRPGSPGPPSGGVDTAEAGFGSGLGGFAPPAPFPPPQPAPFVQIGTPGYSSKSPAPVPLGEEEAQYPTLTSGALGPAALAPSLLAPSGFSSVAAPLPFHHGDMQPQAAVQAVLAPPAAALLPPAALPVAKAVPAAAAAPALQAQGASPSRPVPPAVNASMLAPRLDGLQLAPLAASPADEEEVSSPVAPPSAGWATKEQAAPAGAAAAAAGGDDGGFTFSFSPPVQKTAVELPPLFKGFSHHTAPGDGEHAVPDGWAAGMQPPAQLQAQRAQAAQPKASMPQQPAQAPAAARTPAPQPPSQQPPVAPTPAPAPRPAAAAPAPPQQPPPQPPQPQLVASQESSLPGGGPAPGVPGPPQGMASEQQQWQRPPMVSRETQTVESELAASAPARRYIHSPEDRVAPPGRPGAPPVPDPPSQQLRGGPGAAAFERVRPMADADQDADDGTWYDWWIRARLC